MNRRICSFILISGLALAPLSAAFARPSEHQDHGDRIEKLADRLGLSEEQKAKLEEARKETMAENKALRKKMKEARQEMEALLNSDATDKALKAVHEKIKSLRSQMDDARFEDLLHMKNVLTKEQREKMAQFRHKMKRKWKKHFESEDN